MECFLGIKATLDFGMCMMYFPIHGKNVNSWLQFEIYDNEFEPPYVRPQSHVLIRLMIVFLCDRLMLSFLTIHRIQ